VRILQYGFSNSGARTLYQDGWIFTIILAWYER
jgi:hypothetical protein